MQRIKVAQSALILGVIYSVMCPFVTAAKHLWENKSLDPGCESIGIKRGRKTLQRQQKWNCPLALPVNTASPSCWSEGSTCLRSAHQNGKPVAKWRPRLICFSTGGTFNVLSRLLMNKCRLWQSNVLMNTLLIILGSHRQDPLMIKPVVIVCWLSSLSLFCPEARRI